MATPAPSVVQLKPPIRRWRLDCRGCFALWDSDNRLVELRGRKARAILAYLITHPDEHVTRERLIELLWPDRGTAQARGSLRQSLLEIRRIAPDLINSDHDHVWIDSARLSPIEIADHCSPAEQLFDDLDGITPEFDDWLRCERAAEASEKWSQLKRAAEDLLSRGEGSAAIRLIERMERIDPYNEEWLRLAMRADFQAGYSAGVQTRFREMEDLLKRELGVSLSPQTRALRDELLRDLAKPTAASDPELEETIAARTELQPRSETAASRSRFRMPLLTAAGVVGLVATLGLSQSAQTAAAEPVRIAVLPFAAATGIDAGLAEGLSDELLSQLAHNQRLRVIGRTSADQFKGKTADLRMVGRSLRADYLLEGKLTGSSQRLRIMVSLVRGKDGSVVWARGFDGTGNELQPAQVAIGRAVGQSLGIAPAEAARPTRNGEAYALYLQAKALIRDRTKPGLQTAVSMLRDAVKLDPNFAGAWAQMAGAAYLARQPSILLDQTPRDALRITPREAAARALKLSPDLAEAHAMMALIEGFNKARGRAHLARSLQLNPGDSQTLYWWASAIAATGDCRLSNRIARKAAALDPLWQRPVSAAARAELDAGNPQGGERYLRAIRVHNPEGAAEAEAEYAFASGDFSRTVQLTLGDRTAPWSDAKEMGVFTLIALGYRREGFLLGRFDPFRKAVYLGQVQDRASILEHIRTAVAKGTDHTVYLEVIPELARERRWEDVAAIYDAQLGLIADVNSKDPGARAIRVALGPYVVLALNGVARGREAARLASRTATAGQFILAHGDVSGDLLVSIAANEALLGRRDQALAHLEQAFRKGWRLPEMTNIRIGENPAFATLRGNPRFEQLRRIEEAHIARERREVAALGII